MTASKVKYRKFYSADCRVGINEFDSIEALMESPAGGKCEFRIMTLMEPPVEVKPSGFLVVYVSDDRTYVARGNAGYAFETREAAETRRSELASSGKAHVIEIKV